MQRKIKVDFAIDSIAKAMGGPPQVFQHHVSQIVEAGHDCSLVAYESRQNEELIDVSDAVDCRFVKHAGWRDAIFHSASKSAFPASGEYPDILHIHNVWEPLLTEAGKFARRHGIPYVITPHGMLDPWCMRQKSLKKQIALLLGRRRLIDEAAFIHVLNEDEESGIRKLGIKNRCEILPNGVDLASIDPYFDAKQFFERNPELRNRPILLFLGRLHFKKGLDILAAAASKFLPRYPEWVLVVAGPDDGYEGEFRKLVKLSGIESQTKIIGPVYGVRKFQLLDACSAFVLSSRQEGFSVAILEAMAARKPVVISRECHFPEVSASNAGLTCGLSADEFVVALEQLASSECNRVGMGANGRALVEERYTWKMVVSNLLTKYQQLIS